ncbi:MAG: DUF3256 family protein [Bacteroidales bacterium]
MKKLIFTFGLILLSMSGFAQNIAVYFEVIPEEHLLQVDPNRRKDMLDLKRAGREGKVPNKLGGVSELTELTDTYIRIKVSDNSTLEMKLLPVSGEENIIAIVKSVCAPACDSEILFYNTAWQRLPLTDYFNAPLRADFFVTRTEANAAAYDQALKSVDMDLIQYRFDGETNDLSATYALKDYLPDNIYKEVEPLLKKQGLTYQWLNNKYLLKDNSQGK